MFPDPKERLGVLTKHAEMPAVAAMVSYAAKQSPRGHSVSEDHDLHDKSFSKYFPEFSQICWTVALLK